MGAVCLAYRYLSNLLHFVLNRSLQRKKPVYLLYFSGCSSSTLKLLSGWRSINSTLTPRTFHFTLTCADLLQLIGKTYLGKKFRYLLKQDQMSIDAIGDRGAQWHLKVAKAISIYLAIHPTKKSCQFDNGSLLFDCQYLRQFFIKSSNQVQF